MRHTASAGSSSGGTRTSSVAGRQRYSAYPPTMGMAATVAPSGTAPTPSPSTSTVPTTSHPGVNGGVLASGWMPWRIITSGYETPAASILSRTSPGRGLGRSSSTSSSCRLRLTRMRRYFMCGNSESTSAPLPRSACASASLLFRLLVSFLPLHPLRLEPRLVAQVDEDHAVQVGPLELRPAPARHLG